MKINVNIPEKVLEQTDIRAEKLGISRSSFITMTLSEKLMQTDMIESFPEMINTIRLLAEKEGK